MNNALQNTLATNVPLGQKSPYPKKYDNNLLYAVRRGQQREAMGFSSELSFKGADLWNCFELAWLNPRGKPMRACASFFVPANSPYLAESKSVKLYLNSLNSQIFEDAKQALDLIEMDLSNLCQAPVKGELNPKSLTEILTCMPEYYFCLDDVEISINKYERDPELLRIVNASITNEKVYTNLFKSHCLCTGQPDWGSIFIDYTGPEIARDSILAYLVSFHNHVGFSENCIEQIFVDIMQRCCPERLTVFGRFTRRGGIDINPYRSTEPIEPHNWRLIFQ